MLQLLCSSPLPAPPPGDQRRELRGRRDPSSLHLESDPSFHLRRLCSAGDPSPAIPFLLNLLRTHPSTPSLLLSLPFPPLLSALSRLSLPDVGLQLHSLALKLGLFPTHLHLRNSLLHLYSTSPSHLPLALSIFLRIPRFDPVATNSILIALLRSGSHSLARKLFDEMPQRTLSTWSILISGYVRSSMYSEALTVFRLMQARRISPNPQILVSLLGACGGLGALDQGEWLCRYIEKHSVEINAIVLTAIIDMYWKCGRVDKAAEVFANYPKTRPLSSWNSMVFGLAAHGHGRDAARLFSELESSGLVPDHVSFLSVLTACNHSGMVEEGREYFARMRDVYGIEPTAAHYGCMVDLLGRAGLLDEAEELIHTMPMEPDVVVWGSLLSACRIHGNVEMGRRAAKRVAEIDPQDSGGYVLMANMYAGVGEFERSVRARSRMKEAGTWKSPGCSMVEIDGVVHEFF